MIRITLVTTDATRHLAHVKILITITIVITDATRHLAHVKILIRITIVTTVVISISEHTQTQQKTLTTYGSTEAEQYLKNA